MAIEVVFYTDHGEVPALEWLAEQPRKVQEKFRFLIDLLSQQGGALTRPYAAPLRDGIYELRVGRQNVNYRLLYFFHGRLAAVLAHGCTKEQKVDDADIDRAIRHKTIFASNPEAHTYNEDDSE